MNKLPTLNDIVNKDDIAIIKGNDFNVLVNNNPKKEWIQEHPLVSGLKYIPIERIEWLLTNICIHWRVEVKDVKLIGNSVCVTVRLHYYNPATSEWMYQDGIGASPLQTDKDAGAIDFNALKSGAVMMAAPAAESFAIKDAAEKIGKLFGKDLNRKDVLDYSRMAGRFIPEKKDYDRIQYAENLLRTSTFDDEQKEQFELDLTTASNVQIEEMIELFSQNQLDKMDGPGYKMGDIHRHLDKISDDNRMKVDERK